MIIKMLKVENLNLKLKDQSPHSNFVYITTKIGFIPHAITKLEERGIFYLVYMKFAPITSVDIIAPNMMRFKESN